MHKATITGRIFSEREYTSLVVGMPEALSKLGGARPLCAHWLEASTIYRPQGARSMR